MFNVNKEQKKQNQEKQSKNDEQKHKKQRAGKNFTWKNLFLGGKEEEKGKKLINVLKQL